MGVCLIVALVLVKGIYADECGTMTITEPVLANRPLTVTLSSKHPLTLTATWIRFVDNHWEKTEEYPDKYRSYKEGHVYKFTINKISKWDLQVVRVKLGKTDLKRVCSQDIQFKVIQPGKCGRLNTPSTFIRPGQSVLLEFLPKRGRQGQPLYQPYVLLFMNDGDVRAIFIGNVIYSEHMDEETGSFKYTLDSPMLDGIYLVNCSAEDKSYSTTLRLEKAVKPSVPKLKNVNSTVGGCESCIFISAEEKGIHITCNVSGGTGPKNVTISVGTHTLPGRFYNNLYMSYFPKDHLKHGSEVRCEVLNPALDRPLKTAENVYIYREKRPNFTEIKLYDVIAGEEGTIECVSNDMRPASNLILNVDGISCNTTEDVSENNIIDTYNVTATCSFTASKTLHNKTVKCCLGDHGYRHCQTKQLNILFPPGHVEAKQVEFQDDEEKFKQTVLSCYVSSANPPCRARWEIPPEITDYRTENFNRTIGLNEREKILSKLFLNATRLNHGQQIRCIAVCGNFEVKSDVVSLNVPGAPLIKVFPGNMVTKREGESLTLNCTVDSIPKSNLSWNHGNDILSEPGSTRCDNYSKCYQTYLFENLDKSQTGNYTCTAHNDQFEPTKEIVLLRVIEPDSVTGNNENLMKKTWFIPAVAGGGAVVLIVIFLVVVITVTRRKKTKTNSMEPNGHNERQDAADQMQGEIEEEHDANIGGEQGAGVENVTYATVVKDNVRPSTSKDRQVSHDDGQVSKEGGNSSSTTEQVQTDNTYAQVLPRAERQKQSQNASASGERELIYLDVEFNKALPGSKVKGGRQSDVERTEYVSIDFSKKAPTDF